MILALPLFTFACNDGSDEPDARITPEFDAPCTNCTPDAAPVDADETPDTTPPIDADTTPDAPPPPVSKGTISIQEVEVVGVPQLGEGLGFNINFLTSPNPDYVHPGSNPTLGTGCFVWDYDLDGPDDDINTTADNETIPPYLNAGTVGITATDGTPVIPNCVFGGATNTYICPGAMGNTATGAQIMDAPDPTPAGVWLFIDTDAAFTAADVGRYLKLSGAATAGNNGAFPIVNVINATTLAFANAHPAAAAETLPTDPAATWVILAGVGPIPGFPNATLPDGFIENDDEFSVTLDVTGSETDIAAITTAQVIKAAPDFALDTASAAAIVAMPTNGTATTLACDPGDCAWATGAALFGSIVTIEATDGDVTGLPPYVMPAPASRFVSIRCAVLAQGSVTIPAEVMTYLQGATRIKTFFVHTSLNPSAPRVSILAGHTKAGYTTPTP